MPTPTPTPTTPRLTALAQRSTAYAPLAPAFPIDLYLDANEGPPPPPEILNAAASTVPNRYPSTTDLAQRLASNFGISTARILITAGGDDAIDRVTRIAIEPGRELILPAPTFEMIARYATRAGASIRTVDWLFDPFPTAAILRELSPRTSLISIVSPNNPTGAIASREDLEAIAAAAPNTLILLDLAYTEFAEKDLTDFALTLPNVIIVRTFSKAFGLAGLRVGYAIASETIIAAMRALGNPYPVSSISLQIATAALEAVENLALRIPAGCTTVARGGSAPPESMGISIASQRDARSSIRADSFLARNIARIKLEREELFILLRQLGASPLPSQANFILARFPDALQVWNSLAKQGIAVRRFAAPDLADFLRITLPGNPTDFARLTEALTLALQPALAESSS